MKINTCILSLALISSACGSHKDSKKVPPATEVPPVPASTPTPVPTAAPVPPTNLTSSEEAGCMARSADYEWVDGKCTERPNEILKGELAITEGIIWEPDSKNCTASYDLDNKPTPSFRRCEGVDVTIPLVRPAAGKGKNLLRISYSCSMVIEFPIDIEIGNISAAIAPKKDGSDVLKVVTDVDADTPINLKMKFISGHKNGGIFASAVSYPKSCKISLLANSIIEPAQ